MHREQLEHVLRAACSIANTDAALVIGSQAIIVAAGCLIPGTQRCRRPEWRFQRKAVHTTITSSHSAAHPARQIARPAARHAQL